MPRRRPRGRRRRVISSTLPHRRKRIRAGDRRYDALLRDGPSARLHRHLLQQVGPGLGPICGRPGVDRRRRAACAAEHGLATATWGVDDRGGSRCSSASERPATGGRAEPARRPRVVARRPATGWRSCSRPSRRSTTWTRPRSWLPPTSWDSAICTAERATALPCCRRRARAVGAYLGKGARPRGGRGPEPARLAGRASGRSIRDVHKLAPGELAMLRRRARSRSRSFLTTVPDAAERDLEASVTRRRADVLREPTSTPSSTTTRTLSSNSPEARTRDFSSVRCRIRDGVGSRRSRSGLPGNPDVGDRRRSFHDATASFTRC